MNTENQKREDEAAVDAFAVALKEKLAKAREKGRHGWRNPEWKPEDITHEILVHVGKGDPLDVAIYAMFLHQRGEFCTPSLATSVLEYQPKEP